MASSPWVWVAGAAAAIGAWFAFRPKSASAASDPKTGAAKGPCGDWTGDAKAVQNAISAALKKNGQPGLAVIDGRPGAMTCRGAEWLIANAPDDATPEIRALANSTKCGCGAKRAPCGVTGPTASAAVKEAILAAVVKRGYPREQGQKAVQRESGWRPSAVACMGKDKHPVAGGLMGFIPVALKSVGYAGSPDQFAALSGEEQLPYLLKFISKMPPTKLARPGEFGLALFTPGFVDKPESTVIYDVGSLGWEQNPGLRTAGGGPITVGSVLKTG